MDGLMVWKVPLDWGYPHDLTVLGTVTGIPKIEVAGKIL